MGHNLVEPISRHQCMIYEGAPSRHLPMLATVVCDKLGRNLRCLYLNSPPMVAGMRSCLAASGLDVERAEHDGRLLLQSAQDHLVEGLFEPDQMILMLEQFLEASLQHGYSGLWASGDMTWEMGLQPDLSKLLDYEWQLEKFMQSHSELSGICQYHADTLPRSILRQAFSAHPAVYVNATLTRINPYYLEPAKFTHAAMERPDLDAALQRAMAS